MYSVIVRILRTVDVLFDDQSKRNGEGKEGRERTNKLPPRHIVPDAVRTPLDGRCRCRFTSISVSSRNTVRGGPPAPFPPKKKKKMWHRGREKGTFYIVHPWPPLVGPGVRRLAEGLVHSQGVRRWRTVGTGIYPYRFTRCVVILSPHLPRPPSGEGLAGPTRATPGSRRLVAGTANDVEPHPRPVPVPSGPNPKPPSNPSHTHPPVRRRAS